jgi:hypothetical protein
VIRSYRGPLSDRARHALFHVEVAGGLPGHPSLNSDRSPSILASSVVVKVENCQVLDAHGLAAERGEYHEDQKVETSSRPSSPPWIFSTCPQPEETERSAPANYVGSSLRRASRRLRTSVARGTEAESEVKINNRRSDSWKLWVLKVSRKAVSSSRHPSVCTV